MGIAEPMVTIPLSEYEGMRRRLEPITLRPGDHIRFEGQPPYVASDLFDGGEGRMSCGCASRLDRLEDRLFRVGGVLNPMMGGTSRDGGVIPETDDHSTLNEALGL